MKSRPHYKGHRYAWARYPEKRGMSGGQRSARYTQAAVAYRQARRLYANRNKLAKLRYLKPGPYMQGVGTWAQRRQGSQYPWSRALTFATFGILGAVATLGALRWGR